MSTYEKAFYYVNEHESFTRAELAGFLKIQVGSISNILSVIQARYNIKFKKFNKCRTKSIFQLIK